ncbi:MAG TPA: class I SAM-dependent methyltransferase [bacterium]|nr:class I SAM-dependent methyltransferase [bacterium]
MDGIGGVNTFEQRYQEGVPPWEIGRPQSWVVELFHQDAFEGDILDVGCGTGENALFLATQGLAVTGVDFSRTAIELAQEKAAQRHSSARFRVGNALKLPLLKRTFDTALDSALFHVFTDKERTLYAESLAAALKPQGVAYVVCFSEREPDGWGPRRVTQGEIQKTFQKRFDVASIQRALYETNLRPEPVQAWLTCLQLK